MFQQRRNSAAAVPDWRDPRFSSNASKNFGGAQGNPFYGQQLQSSGQPFSINNSDSNNYSRANATLPPIRSSSTAPFSQPNSIRPGARPPSPTGSFRFLSLSNGPASPTSMPYYSQSSFSYTPSAPRSSGAPQMPQYQRRSSEGDPTMTQPGLVPEKKKLTRARKAAPECCHVCGVADTPEWRRGPTGLRTLCNGCGLQAAKLFASTEPKSVDEALNMLESIGKARFRSYSYALPPGARERAVKTFNAESQQSPPKGGKSPASDAFEAALSLEAMSRNAGSILTSPASSVSSNSSQAASTSFSINLATARSRRTSSFGQVDPVQRPLPRLQTTARPQTPLAQQPKSKNRMDLSHLVSPESRPSSRQERRSSFSFGSSFKF